jgi:putative DNA primase/helicase
MQQGDDGYHGAGQPGQSPPVVALRHALVAAGFTPLPLFGKAPPAFGKNNDKKGLNGWQNLEGVTSEQIEGWDRDWPDAINTGILTKFTPALDLDIYNEEAARAAEELMRERFEERGTVPVRIGLPPKRALLFRTDEPFAKIKVDLAAPNGSAQKPEKLEFLCDGQQLAVFGIHPDTKQPYRWHGGEPGQIKHDELPLIDSGEAQALIGELAELLVRNFGYSRPTKRKRASSGETGRGGSDWADLLANINTGAALHDSLRDLSAKLAKAGTNPGAIVNQLRAQMEASEAPHDERWKARYDDIPRLVESAVEKYAEVAEAAARDDARPPEYSDDALALRFAVLHANDLRYVAEWGRWLRYDGMRWRFDDTLVAFDRARVICRAAAAECNKLKSAKGLASAKTVAAVERLARSDRRLAATVDQWDADLWLLNTPKGVIDLRTGIMREHRADDYLTHMTAVAPEGECPLWRKFLNRVTGGDEALQQYLQRVCGYGLTGLTHEHALFFLYGKGANGKTTFVTAVAGILEDYHRTAPIETFAASHTDRHPTELADLRGARLVTANETEEGRRWAESRINMLTGGDRVRARFMRQDLFEFTPQLKLVISGNHKPSLRSVTEAARRRFNLIPFTVTIPAEERDKDLGDKLRKEWPGILQWMIDGCRDWQKRGLAPPEAVTAATTAYLDAQDTVAAWLDECCELNANVWERSQTLFASWKTFAERSGHFVGDTKTFRDRLDGRDGIRYRLEPGTKRAGFQGVHLKQPPEDPYYADRWRNP